MSDRSDIATSLSIRSPGEESTIHLTNASRENAIDRLSNYLQSQSELAIAVSGGVDSLTLAWVAHESTSGQCQIVHAVSPAVPPEATELVKRYATLANWDLTIINANEYDDPQYRSNPLNRCYYCKTNLYSRITEVTGRLIASGTNTDDLSDFRPGLEAAKKHAVIHPYVETGINKQTIRDIATQCNLTDVAVLPAQPCLASRVETGIPIDSADLHFINTMESMLRKQLSNGDIRCRLTASGVRVEIEPGLFENTDQKPAPTQTASIEQLIKTYCSDQNRVFVGLSEYSRGSAFLHKPTINIQSI